MGMLSLMSLAMMLLDAGVCNEDENQDTTIIMHTNNCECALFVGSIYLGLMSVLQFFFCLQEREET